MKKENCACKAIRIFGVVAMLVVVASILSSLCRKPVAPPPPPEVSRAFVPGVVDGGAPTGAVMHAARVGGDLDSKVNELQRASFEAGVNMAALYAMQVVRELSRGEKLERDLSDEIIWRVYADPRAKRLGLTPEFIGGK
jgi:hypothetical protein